MINWTPSINQDKTFLLLSSSLLKWMCQSNWHLVVYYSWNIDLPKVYRIEGDAQHGNGAIFFYFNINNLKPVVISLSFTPIRSAVYCCVFGVARLDNLCVSSLIGICTLRHREVTQSFSLCTYFYSKHLGPSSYNYTYCMSEFGTIYEHRLSPIPFYSCGVPQSFPDQL